MKLSTLKYSALLLSLTALTACPNNADKRTAVATPMAQTPPPAGAGQLPTNPISANPNLNMKTVQCEFEAERVENGKFFNSNVNIPKTIAMLYFDSRNDRSFNLRNKFLGLDIGRFGKISLKFVPAANSKNGADTIILVNEGLEVGGRKTTTSQSGFAGEEVKLEARAKGMLMTVACKGTSQFKGKSPQTTKTNLVCSGKSNTISYGEEKVEVVLPLNTLTGGQEFTIANSISGKLNANASNITYSTVLDNELGPNLVSTGSLNANSTIKSADGVAAIDITCQVQ